MASASVKEFSNAWWAEVYNRIIGAIVFIDEATCECLHWEGGLFNLMYNGAACVKLLSPFAFFPSHLKKAVFITQTEDIHLKTIREIIMNAEFTHCILISTFSLDTVYVELAGNIDVSDDSNAGLSGSKAQQMLTDMIQKWIGGTREVVIDVVHIPIFAISMTNVLLTMPPFANLYPSINNVLMKETVADLLAVPYDDRITVRRFASALNSMLDSMNLQEDVFYMGPYSSVVAGILENSPICLTRRKQCLHPASLILVDRSLDLCSVSSHSSESVIDKIRSVLPRFPEHANDCAVDMTPICMAKSVDHPQDPHMSPGYLYHAGEDPCIQTFDYMVNKTQKEVMVDVYNKLSKINPNRSPGPRNLLKVTPQSLEKIITAFKGNYDVISKNLGVVQQGLGLIQMHKSPKRATMDLLMNLEKQVLQSLATSRESTSVLTQIAHLIKTRKQRELSMVDLLGLLIHVYSLTGTELPFAKHQETEIADALTLAIAEENQTLFSNPQDTMSDEMCRVAAQDIMVRLNDIKSMRKSLQKYNSLLKPCESGDGYECKGLLQQLVEDLVNTARPDMPDLKQNSDVVQIILRAGLNMLGMANRNKVNKHPLDNQTVILFIIGGTTGEECKQLHRTVITSGVDNTFLFGATRLQTPEEAARQYLQL